MSCLYFLSSTISSSSVRISPSTRTRMKPSRFRSSNSLPYSPLRPLHDRREHAELGALGQLEDAVDDLVGRLALDLAAADRAVRDADARVEQPQVVVDLGDGAHRRARVLRSSSSGRWRRPATAPRCGRRRACPSGRGTAARTPRGTRRSAAAPRRRWCRRPASSCPSRTAR